MDQIQTPQPASNEARHGIRRAAGLVAYDLKTRVASVPALALPLARLRRRGEPLERDTDIVIESFPRCASSFAVAAFRLAQEPRAMRIANHTHMPAQVLAAVRREVPALVLIREPEAAVLSHVVHTPQVTVVASLRGFVRFYEPLIRVRSEIVIGTFEQVVADFGSVTLRVNERFGTHFRPFEHTEENLARLSREIETDYRSRARSEEELERIIPRPSTVRDALKARLRSEYGAAPTPLRERAEAAFRALAPDR